MTTEPKFKAGDIVVLKSGGNKMTVARYLDPRTSTFDDLIECMYSDEKTIIASINVREIMLELVKPE